MIWVEKYRPKKFEDVIGLPPQFMAIVDNPTHMLLVGKAGCGKTTCAKIFAKVKKADLYELNASDDRGIQMIRDKVKFFAQRMSINLKVMFLDEADGMTPDAQNSLRRTMELCARKTIFILTANFMNKIIDPIRSRCAVIEFPAADKDDIVKRLEFICKSEGVKYQTEDLLEIVNKTHPDIRKAIHGLQSCNQNGKIVVANLEESEIVMEAIVDCIKEKNYETLRDALASMPPDYDRLYRYIFDRVYETNAPDDEKKVAMVEIGDRLYKHNLVSDPEINFMACVFMIEKVFEYG